MMAVGVLAFVVALLVSVMLHEAGHFAAAKAFGMKATQFFVGFGPTLWSRRKGETEYGVKAIPAGGFVKIIGMTPLEEVAPEDRPRAFINKGGWQRFVVLVAGSTMHFIIAIVLLFVLAVGWATHNDGGARIATVYTCAVPDDSGNCAPGAVPAPAQGVLHKGDVIVTVNGTRVSSAQATDPTTHHTTTGGPDAAIALIKSTSGPVHLTIERSGHLQQVTITPAVVSGVPHLGVAIEPHLVRLGPLGAVPQSFRMFGEGVVGSFSALGHVPHELAQIVSNPHAKRTVDSGSSGGQVTSVVGVALFAGEAFQADGVSGGVATLVSLVASVNLFVGIFNLFPLLPLDGGHVAILAYEKARDAVRRRRRLPKAGPVDLTKLMPLTYGALALIVGMSVLVLYADVVNPVANPFQ